MFCLPKYAAETFKGKIKDGTINPEQLSEMTSKERRDFFTEHFGESNAKNLNAEFESKLLLKNQQQGIINWAKSAAGMKPEIMRDILSKVNKMTEVLQPKEMSRFMEDLAAKKLGMGVTAEEAGKIAELAKKVTDTKTVMDKGGDRLAYGKAKVDFGNYVSDLKNEANKTTLAQKIKSPLETVSNIGGFAKSLKASLDNSAIFRQGWKTMFSNPGIWMKNASQSFADIAKTFGGKKVMDEVQAEILSRPTYDLMKKAKLAIGTTEESFPSHLAEKVPVLGKAYQASENAYTGFVYRMRADIFDKYLNIAKKSGVDVSDKAQLESIGKLVNSLTGRGSLGKYEPAGKALNNLLFSPRFLKSNIDLFTQPFTGAGGSNFVRMQAAKNLLKVGAGTFSVLSLANAIKPGSVEADPRSSDFGKIKVGDSRFDVSGGIGSLITLISRLGTMSSKSSTTGKVNPLNARDKKGNPLYGATTGWDVLTNFASGKLAPLPGIGRDILQGKDFNGNKPTLLNEANNLFTPLPIQNYLELKADPNSAGVLPGMISDMLGISVNTYQPTKKK